MMDIFSLLLLLSPAAIANMMPVIANRYSWLPKLNIPIDGKCTFRGQRLFGDHKTVRGFFVGIFLSSMWGGVLFFFSHFLPIDPKIEIFFLFGFLAGLGALLGDAIESSIKRQCGIPSGRPLLPFDQIDYIFGFLLCTFPLIHWTFWEMGFFLLLALVLNPLVNGVSFLLGIKKTFW